MRWKNRLSSCMEHGVANSRAKRVPRCKVGVGGCKLVIRVPGRGRRRNERVSLICKEGVKEVEDKMKKIKEL
jgi:hypothetical protein